MAGLKSMVVLIIMMVASLQLQSTVAQTRHVVGDALGWTIPPGGAATYATWASQRTFTVGDTLFFNFTTGLHNVAEISSSATHDPCTPTNIISLNPTGPTTLTLTRPGNHYYMCTVVSHCQIGQKLSIIVSPNTATPRSTPSATLSPPSVIASTPTVGPIPSPTMSASPSVTALVPLTFMAVVLALFY